MNNNDARLLINFNLNAALLFSSEHSRSRQLRKPRQNAHEKYVTESAWNKCPMGIRKTVVRKQKQAKADKPKNMHFLAGFLTPKSCTATTTRYEYLGILCCIFISDHKISSVAIFSSHCTHESATFRIRIFFKTSHALRPFIFFASCCSFE